MMRCSPCLSQAAARSARDTVGHASARRGPGRGCSQSPDAEIAGALYYWLAAGVSAGQMSTPRMHSQRPGLTPAAMAWSRPPARTIPKWPNPATVVGGGPVPQGVAGFGEQSGRWFSPPRSGGWPTPSARAGGATPTGRRSAPAGPWKPLDHRAANEPVPERVATGNAPGAQITAISYNIPDGGPGERNRRKSRGTNDGRPWPRRSLPAPWMSWVSRKRPSPATGKGTTTTSQWESLRRALAKKGYGHAPGFRRKVRGLRQEALLRRRGGAVRPAYLLQDRNGGTRHRGNRQRGQRLVRVGRPRHGLGQVFRTRETPSATTFLVVENARLDFEGINERGNFGGTAPARSRTYSRRCAP